MKKVLKSDFLERNYKILDQIGFSLCILWKDSNSKNENLPSKLKSNEFELEYMDREFEWF